MIVSLSLGWGFLPVPFEVLYHEVQSVLLSGSGVKKQEDSPVSKSALGGNLRDFFCWIPPLLEISIQKVRDHRWVITQCVS